MPRHSGSHPEPTVGEVVSRAGVRVLEDADPIWRQIESDPRFSIYHQKTWKELVEVVFGHRAMYLAATDDQSVLSVLPLFLVRKPLLGGKLISTPYEGCHGGLGGVEGPVREALVAKALRLAEEVGARYLEIRDQHPQGGLPEAGFVEQQPLLVSTVELVDEEANFSALSAKHRRNVRQARKFGVEVSQAESPAQMKAFYEIVSDHYRGLGIPYPGPQYFEGIWNRLVESGRARLFLANVEGEMIGGHLVFLSGRGLISKYAAYLKDDRYRKAYASYALFWEAIRHGIEQGLDFLNMGVTGEENTGLLDFKNRFGASTGPVHFYYYPLRGKLPDYSEMYGGFSLVKKVWSLLPAVTTRQVGHQVNTWFC